MTKFYTKLIILILTNMLISFSANAVIDALRVKVTNGIYSDSTVVHFLPTLTTGFDLHYDAHKNNITDTAAPVVFTTISPYQWPLSINALPSLNTKIMVELSIKVSKAGAFTIQSFELGTFLPGVSIMLEDKLTGMNYPFREGSSYTLNLVANTMASSNRFILHFSPPTNIAITPVTCFGSANGELILTKPGNTNWDYQLKDNTGSIIRSGNTMTENTIITGLNTGIYTIETFSNHTLQDANAFAITQPDSIIVDFEIGSTEIMNTTFRPIEFENKSSGATSFVWDFGDGSPLSTEPSPIYQYSSAGLYTVTLSASNLDCQVIRTNTLVVYPSLTTNAASISQEQNTVSIFQRDNVLLINSQMSVPGQMTITIFNTLGQNMFSISRENTTHLSESIKLPVTGTYFVTVYANNKRIDKKILYLSN